MTWVFVWRIGDEKIGLIWSVIPSTGSIFGLRACRFEILVLYLDKEHVDFKYWFYICMKSMPICNTVSLFR